jgi:signal peptidase I
MFPNLDFLLQSVNNQSFSKFFLVLFVISIAYIVGFLMSFFSLRHLVTIVTSESMRPSFGRGDILISLPASQNVTVGDVVLVQVGITTICNRTVSYREN